MKGIAIMEDTIFYCRDCDRYFGETEIIPGETIAEDEFTYNACPSCNSSEAALVEVGSGSICPCCQKPHDPDWKGEWEECFDALYSDSRAILYMSAAMEPGETAGIMECYSDRGSTKSLKQILWDDDRGIDFIHWAAEFDGDRGISAWDTAYRKHEHRWPWSSKYRPVAL